MSPSLTKWNSPLSNCQAKHLDLLLNLLQPTPLTHHRHLPSTDSSYLPAHSLPSEQCTLTLTSVPSLYFCTLLPILYKAARADFENIDQIILHPIPILQRISIAQEIQPRSLM